MSALVQHKRIQIYGFCFVLGEFVLGSNLLHKKNMAHSDTVVHFTLLLVFARFIYVWNVLLSSPHSCNEHQIPNIVHKFAMQNGRREIIFRLLLLLLLLLNSLYWHSFTNMYHVNISVCVLCIT